MALAELIEIGFTGLEVCTPHIELCVSPELRQVFSDHVARLGLRFCRYNTLIPHYFDTLNSRDQVTEVVECMKRDVDTCVDFGIDQLLTWEGRIPAGLRRDAIFGWVLDETVNIFQEVVPYAAQRGVTISLEVHPFSLGSDLEWLIQLCDRVDSTSFGVTFDGAHFAVAHPTGYVDAIYRLAHRIKHLHLADSDLMSPEVHFPLGMGKMDLDAVIKALGDVKFSGTTMIDVWLYPFPVEAARISMAFVKSRMAHLLQP